MEAIFQVQEDCTSHTRDQNTHYTGLFWFLITFLLDEQWEH